jgi:hypothetical protein
MVKDANDINNRTNEMLTETNLEASADDNITSDKVDD